MKKAKSIVLECKHVIIDWSVYPRGTCDPEHVARLAEAEENGAVLPPIVLCRKTRRLVDGVHRLQARMRRFEDAATIAVEYRDYRDDGELFLDACRLNAVHGLLLTRADRDKAMRLAHDLGITAVAISKALHADRGGTKDRHKALADMQAKEAPKRKRPAKAPVRRSLSVRGKVLSLITKLVKVLPDVEPDDEILTALGTLQDVLGAWRSSYSRIGLYATA